MNILYKIVKQQKSTDNGRTWIDTGNKKVGGILEYDSDCTIGGGSVTPDECTPSLTYSNYNLISVEVMDENKNSLGIFDANGSNTIDTNITVEYNKDIKIKEVNFSRQATTVKTDCTTTTITETPTLFMLPYSISPAENTTSNTQKATITFNIEDELTCYVTFYRSGK